MKKNQEMHAESGLESSEKPGSVGSGYEKISYNVIKAVKASVGGYFGGYYNAEIDLINLKVVWTHGGNDMEEVSIYKTIRKATAVKFIEQMQEADLLAWEDKYIEPGICDGTQWSIEIICDSGTIEKHGDNKFPKKWEVFCNAIKKITGKKFE
ncbi:hypothetical protein [Anaerobium acetethylicum]|uniref:Uncharacterized protein n=1 Tax=Anaerobium acetethylicum TaxID=1619234 RepID=A0A1D3TUN5_9FIRM|nr:hypothetical protein [Anaerobium acetethylicum]SCP97776.1 hypothetical protein SAMN05421730_101381 [Anaerobium acetethylicum]